jgi:hypothetical protein
VHGLQGRGGGFDTVQPGWGGQSFAGWWRVWLVKVIIVVIIILLGVDVVHGYVANLEHGV